MFFENRKRQDADFCNAFLNTYKEWAEVQDMFLIGREFRYLGSVLYMHSKLNEGRYKGESFLREGDDWILTKNYEREKCDPECTKWTEGHCEIWTLKETDCCLIRLVKWGVCSASRWDGITNG